MHFLHVGLACLVSYTIMGLATAGYHGGGYGGVGVLLGVGLLAKLLQGNGHGHAHHHHHHVHPVYIPVHVHHGHHGHHHHGHHGHGHHGYGHGYGYSSY